MSDRFIFGLYNICKAIYSYSLRKIGFSVPSIIMSILNERIGKKKEFDYWKILYTKNNNTFPNKHYERLMCSCGKIDSKQWFAGKTVLDIGCGPAGSLNWCDTARFRIGIDPLCEEYTIFNIKDHDMIYLNCNAERIPLPSGSVDVIFSINSLDHVQKPLIVAHEIRRLLKTGGYFILSANLYEEANPREPHSFTPKIIYSLFSQGFELLYSKIGPHPIAIKSIKEYDGFVFSKNDPLWGYQFMLYEGSAIIESDTSKSHIMWCRFQAV